ncbi:MAG: DUF4197 domain-containing protein [Pseudomonadota bacterium]|nr:DUF4197 domain-containing protein [Pseudomonadota bacterium]
MSLHPVVGRPTVPVRASRRLLLTVAVAGGLALLSQAPRAADALSLLSKSDATAGLREALTRGASAAVDQLGQPGGFLDSERFRIPLPPALDTASRAMRMVGMGSQADALSTAMNRAAEAAVPEARTLLIDAVRSMTVQDAKGILTGGDDAATQYFRRTTHDQLAARFLPIVHQATAQVGMAQAYDRYASQGAQFGLVKEEDAKLDPYVTGKALDALYALVADKEKAIRADPVGQGSKLLGKVFGAALAH